MKPHVHAERSAAQFGGRASDYLAIHELLDSSRAAFPDVRHRVATHNTWFITEVIPRVFGATFRNSEGQTVSSRAVAEKHVSEDFGNLFIPSLQDYAGEIEMRPWMDNARDGDLPPSRKKMVGRPLRPPTEQILDEERSPLPHHVITDENDDDFAPCGGEGRLD